jgi:hypothetical protein
MTIRAPLRLAAGLAPLAACCLCAAAPPPTKPTSPEAPVNLCVRGVWLPASREPAGDALVRTGRGTPPSGAPSDDLEWDPVPGAASYRIYRYGALVGSVKAPAATFRVPPDRFVGGTTYTVTAVGPDGAESLPGAPALAQGAPETGRVLSWTPGAGVTPVNIRVVPEWQASSSRPRPRNRVTWSGKADPTVTYAVYRDGEKRAEGLWGLNYIDDSVRPGASYTYQVTQTSRDGDRLVESARSAPIAGVALSVAPVRRGKVTISRVEPNDDSVRVYFAAVPGAADYRCYDLATPGQMKYSGGGTCIEVNGLDPKGPNRIVIEALASLGPFQRMDGAMGPGAQHPDGSVTIHTNGHGDPSNIPAVIAASDPVEVTCKPHVPAGTQVFFDTFRDSRPFTPAAADPAIVRAQGLGGPGGATDPYVREQVNDRWRVRYYAADAANTAVFVSAAHLMDTLYDGGSPGGHGGDRTPPHNNNATITFEPRATADISGDRVLHVTMEIDGHFNARRWCDVGVFPAGDDLLRPALIKIEKNARPTTSGDLVAWQIESGMHHPVQYVGSGPGMADHLELANVTWAPDPVLGPSARGSALNREASPRGNADPTTIDLRHRFDLYLSRERWRLVEDGVVVGDGRLRKPLPFSRCQVYFAHHVYHTWNDRRELTEYAPAERYWYDLRPWDDERHWDNMGFEVLNNFPK